MSYVVLARKYRPQTFAELIGQQAVVQTLANAMATGRVHHAFVLAGTRGVGKTTTARLLAKGLNCERGMSTTPCGTCTSCTQVARGEAPAVLEIDGASNTGVDHVRDLRESARYRPAAGRFKIYIIDEVHMLSQAAFNALLKLLEEPPSHVKFVFATTEPHKLPDTILSRCQRFDFRRVRRAVLAEHLAHLAEREGLTITPSACLTLARQADGSVRDALSLLDQASGFAGSGPVDDQVLAAMGTIDRQLPARLTDALLARDASQVLSLVHDIDVQGHDMAEVMRLLLLHLRDAAVARAVQSEHPSLADLLPHEREALAAQSAQRSPSDWQRLFEKCAQVTEAVARSPVPKATCELGLLRMLQIVPAADVGTLLAQVDTWLAQLPASQASLAALEPEVAPAAIKTTALGDGPQYTLASECVAAPRPIAAERPNGARPRQPGAATGLAQPASPEASAAAAPASLGRPAAPADQVPADRSAAAAAAPQVHGQWQAFVAGVRRHKPSLASLLEHAHVLTFRPGEARVAFAPDSFCLATVGEAANRSWLAAQLGEWSGQDSQFVVVPQVGGAAPEPTLATARAAREAATWAATQEAARTHPGVLRAAATLGGRIGQVVPLGPGA